MFRWSMVLSCAILAAMLTESQTAHAQYSGIPGVPKAKKKKKTEARLKVVDVNTNLDEKQQEEAERIEGFFEKLYGYTDEVPERAQKLVRTVVYNTLDGTYQPKREHTDVFANRLMGVLRARQLGPDYSYKLVRSAAEVLSATELSREDFDNMMLTYDKILTGSRMTDEDIAALRHEVSEMIRKAERNEEKIKEREEARKKEEEQREKERKKKLEEAKKRALRKQRQSETGGGYSREGT